MVFRKKLNKPFGRAKGANILWLTEVGVNWHCNSCFKRIPGDNIAIQSGVRVSTVNTTVFREEYVKVFLCAACAKQMCQELLDTIKTIDATSLKAYKTMRDV